MIYNKQYFIKMFSAIPEEEWNVGDYVSKDGKRRCAYGHCGLLTEDIGPNRKTRALANLFENFYLNGFNHCPSRINDGLDGQYNQATPKQRILAALNDLPD